MKVVGFVQLHYGKQFLEYALQSTLPYVETMYVIYSPAPSWGRSTRMECPDTQDELYTIAKRVCGRKLYWETGFFRSEFGEGGHGSRIFDLATDADVIVITDSDEIWGDGMIPHSLKQIESDPSPVSRYRVPIIHYWRGFHRAILGDVVLPARFLLPHAPDGDGYIKAECQTHILNHFGYAIPPALMEYKRTIHGHIGEFRRDVDWMQDVYLNQQRQNDLHPVGNPAWNWQAVDPLDYLPEWVVWHPDFEKDWIE